MATILGGCCGASSCDCEGERGKRGKRGKRGERGHRGHEGHDGDTGPTGPTGPTGFTGPAGITNVLPFAASFRVQYNNANPIVTVKDIVASPGIFIGFRPLGNRAEGTLFVFGDAITRGTATGSIAVPALGFIDEFVTIVLQPQNIAGSWVVPVDPAGITGPTPAQVAQAVPPLPPVVAGQPILVITVRSRHQQNGVTDNTSTTLEDVALNFSGAVGP